MSYEFLTYKLITGYNDFQLTIQKQTYPLLKSKIYCQNLKFSNS